MNSVSAIEPSGPIAAETQSLPRVENWNLTLPSRTLSISNLFSRILDALKWIMQRARAQHARKNLRVCENVSLGDKRFVAVVQVDEERFLIGGSCSAVALLARLLEAKTFAADVERVAGTIS